MNSGKADIALGERALDTSDVKAWRNRIMFSAVRMKTNREDVVFNVYMATNLKMLGQCGCEVEKHSSRLVLLRRWMLFGRGRQLYSLQAVVRCGA